MEGTNSGGRGESAWQRFVPLGLASPHKPRHYRAILDTLSENYGQWHKAWAVLNGPCNGCALQTDGLRDNVLPRSPHFCVIRLGLIEEVLRRDADPAVFADAAAVRRLGNDRIERLGRLTVPMLWRRGDRGYRPVSFDEAYELAGGWVREHRGSACGFFTTSKGVNNEEYYAFQQFARVVGQTNNVDSCARQCHAASVSALKATLGVGASSGSLADFIHADAIVLAGTNLANNQPLVMRYLEEGKRTRGGKPYVIVVNAYREPGLERYWVPSSLRSALFGTPIADEFVPVRTGGDVAFFNGVLKILIEERLLTDRHRRFIEQRTQGFEAVVGGLGMQSLAGLEEGSGVPAAVMRRVAAVLARSENVLFVWGMGLTQHRTGTDNVESVINLALALGQLGKPHAGLAALRGQSGVQASGECGVGPNIFPGGEAITSERAGELSALWGGPVPSEAGLATGRMIEAADRGAIRLLMCLGGNLRETMPDRPYVAAALRKVAYRIRLDVMMNQEAMIEPGEANLVIPIRNWYEWDSVFTTTSTDRTLRAFRGTLLRGHRDLPESWAAFREIAHRVLGKDADRSVSTSDRISGFSYTTTQEIREMMARTIWMYRGIDALREPHQQMQWGGPTLFTEGFDRAPGGKALFRVLQPQATSIPDGHFLLSTRRGFGQWNSQHRVGVHKDSFTGATTRRAVLMHPDDADALGAARGDPLRLSSTNRSAVTGVCWPDDRVRRGHVQAFWPLANDLIQAGLYDPASVEPDYNVAVRIERADPPPVRADGVADSRQR